jgi:hypothetical protein
MQSKYRVSESRIIELALRARSMVTAIEHPADSLTLVLLAAETRLRASVT